MSQAEKFVFKDGEHLDIIVGFERMVYKDMIYMFVCYVLAEDDHVIAAYPSQPVKVFPLSALVKRSNYVEPV